MDQAKASSCLLVNSQLGSLEDVPVGLSVDFSTMRVVKHWHRLHREVAAALFRETFKLRLDVPLRNLI